MLTYEKYQKRIEDFTLPLITHDKRAGIVLKQIVNKYQLAYESLTSEAREDYIKAIDDIGDLFEDLSEAFDNLNQDLFTLLQINLELCEVINDRERKLKALKADETS